MQEVHAPKKGYVPRIQCPLWVKSRHLRCKKACPFYPQKPTCAAHWRMSAKCQKQTLP